MDVSPMLAAKGDDYWIQKALKDDNWIAEQKFDGSRYITQFDLSGRAKVTSRRISDITGKPVDRTLNFPHLLTARFCIPELAGCTFDGEMLGPNGFSSTTSICGASPETAIKYQEQNGYTTYHVFDLLSANGCWITMLPLRQRLDKLQPLLEIWQNKVNGITDGGVYPIPRITKDKEEYYYKILSAGGEGIILKNLDSFYMLGERKKECWLKMKKSRTWDVVICGFSQPDQFSIDSTGKQIINKYYAKKWIGAIEFGIYRAGVLEPLGKTSGIDEKLRKDMSENPGSYLQRVIEVEGQELTPDGKIRHPRFLRIRDDKGAKECTVESLFQADKSRKSKAIRKEAL